MINPAAIYRFKQLEAVEAILTNSNEYHYRKICRWFSKEYSTPLMEVYKMPWDFVLQNYYESFLETRPYNEVYDLAVQDYLPEMAEEYEKELQEFADSLVDEQEQTLERKEKQQSLDKKPSSEQEEVKEEEVEIEPINLNFGDDEDL